MARNHDPAASTPRTFWTWFKGWPLRVVIALAALFVFAFVVTWLDHHWWWFHVTF